MYINFRIGVACGALLVTLAAESVMAGGLSIWPVQVHLPADGSVQELQVSNPTNETSYVQVMAVEWHEPGEIGQAAPVEDVLAVPPVFELAPNSSQLVRIAARGQDNLHAERPYRLIVTEVPRIAGLVPNTLAVAARMTLPLFVRPKGVSPLPVWSLAGESDAEPELLLVNQGNAYIKVDKVELLSTEQAAPIFSTDRGSLVLAGEATRWAIDVDIARLKGPITIRAQTTAGPIEGEISLSSR